MLDTVAKREIIATKNKIMFIVQLTSKSPQKNY